MNLRQYRFSSVPPIAQTQNPAIRVFLYMQTYTRRRACLASNLYCFRCNSDWVFFLDVLQLSTRHSRNLHYPVDTIAAPGSSQIQFRMTSSVGLVCQCY